MKTFLLTLLASVSVFASTYTPTISNVQYSYGITAHKAMYFVSDSVVHVAGAVTATFDSSFSPVAIMSVSLPVSSNLGGEYDCSGLVGEGPLYNIGHVEADASSDKALIVINPSLSTTPPDLLPLELRYSFDCEVIQ